MKLLILCLLFCGVVAQDVPPAGNWKPYNNHGYIFIESFQSWSHAQQSCLALGGHLASISTKEEDDFVKKLTKEKEAWIGLSDAQIEGSWLWVNSEPVEYTNWCPGEPNNGGGAQNCAQINYSSNKCWDDLQCFKSRPFVCEKKLE